MLNKLKSMVFMLQLFADFGSKIDRDGVAALIPEDVAKEILQGIPQYSTIMSLATKAPNMSRKQRRIPVLSSLPLAYFVDGDTGLKQTSDMTWGNKFFNAEELAVIIPIPEAVPLNSITSNPPNFKTINLPSINKSSSEHYFVGITLYGHSSSFIKNILGFSPYISQSVVLRFLSQ